MSGTPSSPELVILPGLDGTARMLDAFCARLAELGCDARAIGYPPDQPLDYEALEPLVLAQLPSNRPFVLMAESFSGPLALKIASRAPGGLTGLVLSTSFASSPLPWMRPLLGLAGLAPARLPMVALAPLLLGRWATPELKAQLAEALRTVSTRVLRARAVAALEVDASACLREVQVPTLCLQAKQDRLLRSSATRELKQGLADCQVVAVEGPHLLLQTAPRTCAQTVAEFIAGLRNDLATLTPPP